MSEVGPEEFAKKKKVKKVCAVDFSDNTVLEMLEKYYGCDVTCSKYGTEFCDDKDMVFLFEDFDNEAFNNFISVSPASSVLGAAIVKIRRRHELNLPYPRPKRPIYNEMFRNVSVVIGSGEENSRRIWAKLIRYMSGHVKREPDATTSLLITTQAKGKAFRQFVALGQSVVLPSWLLECWEHRNDEAFTPLSENMITKHRIGVFENLRVFVHGFSQAEEEDIKKHIADNRGFIVDSSSKATHCVVNALRDLDNLGFSPGQRFVTNEWVWTSINIQYCANEDTYSVERSKAGQSLSDHIHDKSSFSITDRVSSEGNIAKTAKLSRSHQVCIEIYETDVSYVNALKLLLEVKHGLEQAAESGCPLMQKSEIALIFGKISPIIKVHEAIISRLKQILDNWKSDVEVAQTWIDAHDDLNRVYVPYSNTYDTAGEKLNWADRTNPRLHAFIRAKECKSNFKRNTLQDLLIRPVQRMPTLIVLLKELQKRRDGKSEVVEQAISLIDKVVCRANEVRAQNDNFIEQLNFFNEVEDVPPHLVCSRRKVLRTVEGFSVSGSNEWHTLNRRRVKILLYNDMILICKVRVLPNSGTVGRLDRRTSFSNMMTSKKHFKYFAHLLIHHVREINRVKLSHYEGVVNDRLEPKDALPIHCWTIRDASSDASWFVEALDKEEMLGFIEEVHKKIFMDFGRDVSWPGLSLCDFPSSSVRDAVVKHIKKVVPHANFSLESASTTDRLSAFATLRRRSTLGLRRTVSHMGSFTRLAVPFPFLIHRTAGPPDGQQRYVPSQADTSSVLSVKDFNASYSETRKMESASTICALPSIEEAEKEVSVAVHSSDEEN